MKKVVFVADIADDIDDVIAVEYLNSIEKLECVVLDGKSRNLEREKELSDIGVVFKERIPDNTEFLFCGGALNKIRDFVKENKVTLLVINGGFAGSNIVSKENVLKKFKNKEKVRTYNFNMDIDSALDVISSENVNELMLVSKNVCHSELNCIDKIHDDGFLDKYNLDKGKRLHDLLMVKEGINYLMNGDLLCDYERVTPICERSVPDNMSKWGSESNKKSNIIISTRIKG